MTALTLFPFWWSATREIGFVAYSATGIGCVLFWLRSLSFPDRPHTGIGRLAAIVAAIEFILALDMVFEWRIALHDFFADTFVRHNLYGRRHTFQLELLIVLGCILAFTLGLAFQRLRTRRGSFLAIGALSLSITLWLMEIISLHETDTGLYHLVNGIMVIAFLWVLACSLTLLGVGIEARSAAREG